MTGNLTKKLKDIQDEVFMAGLGIAAAEDISPEDHDTAILNTQKHYTEESVEQITQAFIDDGWIHVNASQETQAAIANTMLGNKVMTREEWEKQAIADGWSPNIPAKNKSDMERILSVKREADIMDVRLLAISTPLYDDKTLQTARLGSTYGIDHVIGMVHQPMYYRLLDDKRGTMTGQEWYDRFAKELDKEWPSSYDEFGKWISEAARKAAGIKS